MKNEKRIYVVPRKFIPWKLPVYPTIILIMAAKMFELPWWGCTLIAIFLFSNWIVAADRMIREQPLWEEEMDLKTLIIKMEKQKQDEADTV